MGPAIPKKRETFEQEIEALFREYYQFVYRAAYHVTRNREDAEDVLQTVYLKLIQGEPSEDFGNNPKGYLYQAAKNTARNVVRSRRLERRAEGEVTRLVIPLSLARASRDAKVQLMRDAMETMKSHLVEVLNLHYCEELSCMEISKITGRSLTSVYVDLYRARTELRKLMGIEEKDDETQKDDYQGNGKRALAGGSEG